MSCKLSFWDSPSYVDKWTVTMVKTTPSKFYVIFTHLTVIIHSAGTVYFTMYDHFKVILKQFCEKKYIYMNKTTVNIGWCYFLVCCTGCTENFEFSLKTLYDYFWFDLITLIKVFLQLHKLTGEKGHVWISYKNSYSISSFIFPPLVTSSMFFRLWEVG